MYMGLLRKFFVVLADFKKKIHCVGFYIKVSCHSEFSPCLLQNTNILYIVTGVK